LIEGIIIMPLKHYVSRLIHYYKTDGLLYTIGRILDHAHWRNPIRVMIVKEIQRRRLIKHYCPATQRLIIFLTLGHNWVSGGILSITSIYNETFKLKEIHGAEVVMCTIPGSELLLKYTKFKNQNYLYSFLNVLDYFQECEELLIHIPELYVETFAEDFTKLFHGQQKKLKCLHINIMLQNIDMIPLRASIKKLETLGRVTCTTAHEAYSGYETEERIGCRIHKLSVWLSPEPYLHIGYSEKDDLMIISLDSHELKSKVLGIIAKQFPQLRLQVIKNLSYEKYRKVISKAKWAITFGEGLDGYFVETILSGGIAFAVYNDRFFTEDFKTLRTVYPDYVTLIQNICADIRELDDEVCYTQYQKQQFEICSKYYNYETYKDNLSSFYRKYFTTVSGV